MIHRDIEIVDLYPLTWRHLGDVFRIDEWGAFRPLATGNVLSILHDQGRIVKIDAPAYVSLPSETTQQPIANPFTFAQMLYAAHPELDRVQIFEQGALRNYSALVQRLDWTQLASADFYQRAFEIAEADTDGLCYYPPERAPFAAPHKLLKSIESLVKTTPDGAALVLGVHDQGKPYFTLIVQVRAGLITLCTTFEYLAPYQIDPSLTPATDADSTLVLAAVEKAIGPVAYHWFGDRQTFEKWQHSVVSG